jgi:hypothetical protein
MRVTLVIAMATLTLGLASRPMNGQMRTAVSPLGSIQMIDAQIGWAATRVCGPCPPQVMSGLMLRTTNGGPTGKTSRPSTPQDRGSMSPTSMHSTHTLRGWRKCR